PASASIRVIQCILLLAGHHYPTMRRENRLRLLLLYIHDVGKLLMLFAFAEGLQHFSMLAGPACSLRRGPTPGAVAQRVRASQRLRAAARAHSAALRASLRRLARAAGASCVPL